MSENDIEPTPSNRVENFFNAKLLRGEPPADEFTRIEKYLSYMTGSAEAYPENANTELEVWLKALCKSGILVPIDSSDALDTVYPNGGIVTIRHTYYGTTYDTLCLVQRPSSASMFLATGVFRHGTEYMYLSIASSSEAEAVLTGKFSASGFSVTRNNSVQFFDILSAYKLL